MHDQIIKYLEDELDIPSANLIRATEGFESEVYKTKWNDRDIYIRCSSNSHHSVQSEIYALMKKSNIPTPELLIFRHNIVPDKDLMIITKAFGAELSAVDLNSKEEENIYSDAADVLRRVHSISLKGYGPLILKNDTLVGSLSTWSEYLTFHYSRLEKLNFLDGIYSITPEESDVIQKVFTSLKVISYDTPVFLHNDYHKNHLFTDGQKITSVIDFDKSLAGDPRYDVARALFFQTPTQRKTFANTYGNIALEPIVTDYMVLIAAGKIVWEYTNHMDSLVSKTLERLKSTIATKVLASKETQE